MRERAVGAALRAYPGDVRARLGAEMAATALDAGAGPRELAGFLRHGLRARGLRVAAAGPRRVIADGLCLAAVWIMTLDLATLVAQRMRGMHDPLLAPASIALLGVALVLALAGLERAAGLVALVWMAARTPALVGDGGAMMLVASTAPAVCFAALVLAPRRRALDLRNLAWLVVPATLVATFGPPPWEQPALLRLVVGVAAAIVILYALALLLTDPRVAIAGALTLASLGAGVPLVACAPLVLAIAATRMRRLARART